VGLPIDDAQTALDRRVEFHPRACTQRDKAETRGISDAGLPVVSNQPYPQPDQRSLAP
jgi:hypothetical protein